MVWWHQTPPFSPQPPSIHSSLILTSNPSSLDQPWSFSFSLWSPLSLSVVYLYFQHFNFHNVYAWKRKIVSSWGRKHKHVIMYIKQTSLSYGHLHDRSPIFTIDLRFHDRSPFLLQEWITWSLVHGVEAYVHFSWLQVQGLRLWTRCVQDLYYLVFWYDCTTNIEKVLLQYNPYKLQ